MNKSIVTIVSVIVMVVVVVGGVFVLGRQQTQKQESKVAFAAGQQGPDFTLKDFDGNEVKFSDFYGKKAVVLDFWAAWCPFCVDEMPVLQKAQDEYKDSLVMIGVHRTDSGESIETGKKFADEQGVTYLLLQGTSEIYEASTKGLKAMPVAVFIDRDGIVQDVKAGPKTEEEIKEKVMRLFK